MAQPSRRAVTPGLLAKSGIGPYLQAQVLWCTNQQGGEIMDFFDKMKDGISKGIDTIGSKGKELMEDTQTQLQISSLKDKRKKSLEDLGVLAYALFQKGMLVDEGAKQACEAIVSLDQQIAAKQAELQQGDPGAKPA